MLCFSVCICLIYRQRYSYIATARLRNLHMLNCLSTRHTPTWVKHHKVNNFSDVVGEQQLCLPKTWILKSTWFRNRFWEPFSELSRMSYGKTKQSFKLTAKTSMWIFKCVFLSYAFFPVQAWRLILCFLVAVLRCWVLNPPNNCHQRVQMRVGRFTKSHFGKRRCVSWSFCWDLGAVLFLNAAEWFTASCFLCFSSTWSDEPTLVLCT